MVAVGCNIPKSAIDQATIHLLQNGGVATLHLPPQLSQIHSSAFQTATHALDFAAAHKAVVTKRTQNLGLQSVDASHQKQQQQQQVQIPIIEANANSGAVTGYHSAGGDNALSRYNFYREGFIFSNGEFFDVPLSPSPLEPSACAGAGACGGENSCLSSSFEREMNGLFDSMCNVIARDMLRGIARHLKIDEGWFEDMYGPMNVSSQWHVKRYVEPSNIHENLGEYDVEVQDLGEKKKKEDTKEEEEKGFEWLPVHTDPSLISILLHDAPGINPLAMGLEYQTPLSPGCGTGAEQRSLSQKQDRVWKEVECHGHAVATVFCGSVLSYITGGMFPSAKHRVMYKPTAIDTVDDGDDAGSEAICRGPRYRQAATLFLRPQGKAVLTVPPSDCLIDRDVKIRKNCKFQDWLNRVSRNYQGGSGYSNGPKAKPRRRGGVT